MTEATALPLDERPRRFHFDWIFPLLFRPRATFAKIVGLGRATWLTPILVLMVTSLLTVAVTGQLKVAAAESGQIELPDIFQYWSPEQQQQYLDSQALIATGPAFNYIFPALLSQLRLWVGWLVLGGLLHLMLTMLGGRDNTGGALNVVAWASLPFAIRDLVRVGYMLSQQQLLQNGGLTGFAPAGEGWVFALLNNLYSRIDIYTIWYVILLYIGVRASVGLSRGKALAGMLIALLIMLVLGVLPTIAISLFSGLSVVPVIY